VTTAEKQKLRRIIEGLKKNSSDSRLRLKFKWFLRELHPDDRERLRAFLKAQSEQRALVGCVELRNPAARFVGKGHVSAPLRCDYSKRGSD
jgi:hypothetical protein